MPQDIFKLPLGTQDFKRLRQDQMLYVDKTEYIYHLIRHTNAAFLSRPRRFGKSLLCSTLHYLFAGERQLFKGLWIDEHTEQIGFEWNKLPVIHLDMSSSNLNTIQDLEDSISFQLSLIQRSYQISDAQLVKTSSTLYLQSLIAVLHIQMAKRVVVLIDEYDAPVVKRITRPLAELEQFKVFLRDFYGSLKASDAHLRFLFLTGISKFTKLSLFSALNNLEDISRDPNYAALLGYTQLELEHYFRPYIQSLAQLEQLNYADNLEKIKLWYNGYRFTRADIKVYNPFSTLNYFKKGKFDNYWFESGTTKLLIDLIKTNRYDVRNLTLMHRSNRIFRGFELEKIELESLLYYTGYLTIAQVYPNYEYDFSFPNQEVKRSFYTYFIEDSFPEHSNFNHDEAIHQLKTALETASEADFKTVLYKYFTQLSYPIQVSRGKPITVKEYYYQSLLYALFYVASRRVSAEKYTNLGRIDAD